MASIKNTNHTKLDEELKLIRDYNSDVSIEIVQSWLKEKSNGLLPKTSIGWFRCGVGFYNKKMYYGPAIICLRIALELDPNNFNAQQVLGRAYLRVNKRDEALESLKRSVQLHSSSDWQLLVEEIDREDRENNA
jgi:tetratricopeptide (TPR) repeat protein